MNLIQKISPLLFKIARSPISGLFVGLSFARLSRFLPVKRLGESVRSIAFYHPVPSYDFHGLVVPKMIKPAFLAFNFAFDEDRAVLIDILRLAQQVGRELELDRFSIIVNGGIYQDVPQVHFHLARNDNQEESIGELIQEASLNNSSVAHFRPATSRWAYHIILHHDELQNGFLDTNLNKSETQDQALALFKKAQTILEKEQMEGFSVMVNVRPGSAHRLGVEIVSNHV